MPGRLRMKLDDKLKLFSGRDNNALGAFALGATGWVYGASNFDPASWSRIAPLCINEGNFLDAREIWYRIMPFVGIVNVGQHGERPDWTAVIKRGLELRGFSVGPVRAPMLPLTEKTNRKVKESVSKRNFHGDIG